MDPRGAEGPFEGPEQAYHWFLNAREMGSAPSFEGFCRRHPEWQDELRALDEDWRAVEVLAPAFGLGRVVEGDEELGTRHAPADQALASKGKLVSVPGSLTEGVPESLAVVRVPL